MKAGLLAFLCSIVLAATPTFAQTNADVNAGLQFNFSPPGARSLALGGAFSGLADDATAAYANPAGLVKLSKPEVSAEFRSWDYATEYPSGGSYPNGRQFQTTESSADDISFLSVVFPVRSWSFALFRHQLSSFEAELDADPISLPGNPTEAREGRLDLDIAGVGAAAAYRFSDALSVGVALAYYTYDSSSDTLQPRINNRQISAGEDEDIGGSVGILWAGDLWSAGLVYRRSPEFEGTSEFICGSGCTVQGAGGPTLFKVPDTFSIGLGFQPSSRVTVAFEYDRVRYSQISDSLTNLLSGTRAEFFEMEDGDEFHLGAELRFPLASQRSLFFRAGGWLDPDHTLRYTAPQDRFDPRFGARFGTDDDREDHIHYSAGLGFAYAQSFQIDAAVDFSDPLDTLSLSAVYRF